MNSDCYCKRYSRSRRMVGNSRAPANSSTSQSRRAARSDHPQNSIPKRIHSCRERSETEMLSLSKLGRQIRLTHLRRESLCHKFSFFFVCFCFVLFVCLLLLLQQVPQKWQNNQPTYCGSLRKGKNCSEFIPFSRCYGKLAVLCLSIGPFSHCLERAIRCLGADILTILPT